MHLHLAQDLLVEQLAVFCVHESIQLKGGSEWQEVPLPKAACLLSERAFLQQLCLCTGMQVPAMLLATDLQVTGSGWVRLREEGGSCQDFLSGTTPVAKGRGLPSG